MLQKAIVALSVIVAATTLPAIGQEAGTDAVKLYGSVIYSDNDVVDNGIYSFNLSGEPSQEAVPDGKDLEANGGGFFADGRYYFNQEMELYGSTYRYHYIFEYPSWTRVSRTSFYNKYDMANDMAYDPMLGCAFGCFPDGTDTYFGSVSVPDFTVTRIGQPLPHEYAGIAIDSEGTVYAIDSEGALFTVDKFTAAATLVGNTGLQAKYQGSAVFDYESKLIYYSVNTDTESKLYTVDPLTAKATFVYDFPNGEQVVGLFIPYSQNPDQPAAVTGLNVAPDGGNLSATVGFVLPSQTYGGTSLSGAVSYEVRVNDVVKVTGSAAAGSDVSTGIQVPSAGEYTVTVFAISDGLRSVVAAVKQYVGNDTPAAVKNAKIEYNADKGGFDISWDAVASTGVNGGYVDPALTTYKVVRYPDEVTVAEATSELSLFNEVAEPAGGMVQYYYSVTPTYAGLTGAATNTNGVSLGTIVPPYSQPFSSADALSGYTIIPNSSFFNNEWTYKSQSVKGPKDSWLITPAIKLTAGNSYDLTFEMKSEYGYVEESMSIYMGTEPTAEAMTSQIMASASVKQTTFKQFSTTFTAEATGIYYIGFICDSSAWNSYGVYMKNLEISAGYSSGVEPVAVGGDVEIYAVAGGIAVVAESPVKVDIYDIAGRLATSITASGTQTAELPHGTYIVRAGGHAAKLMVR